MGRPEIQIDRDRDRDWDMRGPAQVESKSSAIFAYISWVLSLESYLLRAFKLQRLIRTVDQRLTWT